MQVPWHSWLATSSQRLDGRGMKPLAQTGAAVQKYLVLQPTRRSINALAITRCWYSTCCCLASMRPSPSFMP